jgi:heptosyltransferase-3
MTEKAMQLYRQLRHSIRVYVNFTTNYFLLKRLRFRIKRENSAKRLIAVMLLEHLGDIVACEPIVRYLKNNNPNTFIIWGVKRAYRELIDSNPNIDMTLPIHCLSERMMLINIGLFDEIIDLHFSDRCCSLCRKPLKKDYNYSKINLKNYFQYGGLLSAMSQSAGLPSLDDQPKVYIPKSAIRNVDSLHLPKEYMVINCTSNAPEKGWPVQKWIKLLNKMKDKTGLPVFEIGTDTFIDTSLKVSQSLCGKLSILESAEVIQRAKLFIGIDSGPAHLANAVGIFGIVMLGNYLGFESYDPFSGAYRDGSNAVILYAKGSISTIQVDSVFAEVERFLGNS